MTKKEFLELVDEEISIVRETLRKKNSDYTSDSDDPFANFKLAEHIGVGTAEQGLLIRVMDKIQRLKSFTSKGSLQVNTESYQDSLRDIMGYCLLLSGMLKEKQKSVYPFNHKPNTNLQD